jgi:TPR repeat protein
MYEFGKGVTRNEETAVTWYRLAAEKNCAQA